VVSGDVTESGRPRQLDEARAFLTRPEGRAGPRPEAG
jgi:hypothetical protein